MSSVLELKNIHKVFNAGTVDEAVIFNDFNFTVEEGSFISIVGSNGSGKTTLLNLICGTDHVNGGQVVFDGRDITNLAEYKRAAFIGRVFQNPQMGTCPDLTIIENMRWPTTKAVASVCSRLSTRSELTITVRLYRNAAWDLKTA